MTVQIKNVKADISAPAVTPTPASAPAPATTRGSAGGALVSVSDAELRERLRPIVMDILNTELEALLRSRG